MFSKSLRVLLVDILLYYAIITIATIVHAESLSYSCVEDGTLSIDPETNQLAYTLEIANIKFPDPTDELTLSYVPHNFNATLNPPPTNVLYNTTPCHVKVNNINNAKAISFVSSGMAAPPHSSFHFQDVVCSGMTLEHCIYLATGATVDPVKSFIFRDVVLESIETENATALEETISANRFSSLIRTSLFNTGIRYIELTNCHMRVNYSAFHLAYVENNNTLYGTLATSSRTFWTLVWRGGYLRDAGNIVFRNVSYTSYGGIFPTRMFLNLVSFTALMVNVSSMTYEDITINCLPTAPLRLHSTSSSSSATPPSSPSVKSFKMDVRNSATVYIFRVSRFEDISNLTINRIKLHAHFDYVHLNTYVRVMEPSTLIDVRRISLSNIDVYSSYDQINDENFQRVGVFLLLGRAYFRHTNDDTEFSLVNATVVCDHTNGTSAAGAVVNLVAFELLPGSVLSSLARTFTISSSRVSSNFISASNSRFAQVFVVEFYSGSFTRKISQMTNFHFNNISAVILQNVANNNDEDVDVLDSTSPIHSKDVLLPRPAPYLLFLINIRKQTTFNARSLVIENCEISISRTPELISALASNASNIYDGTHDLRVLFVESPTYIEEKVLLNNNHIAFNLLDESIRHHLLKQGYQEEEVAVFLMSLGDHRNTNNNNNNNNNNDYNNLIMRTLAQGFLQSLPTSSAVTSSHQVRAYLMTFDVSGASLSGVSAYTQLSFTNSSIKVKDYNRLRNNNSNNDESSADFFSLTVTRDLFIRAIHAEDILNVSSIFVSNIDVDVGHLRGSSVTVYSSISFVRRDGVVGGVLLEKVENGHNNNNNNNKNVDVHGVNDKKSFIVQHVTVRANFSYFEMCSIEGVVLNSPIVKAYDFDLISFNNISAFSSVDWFNNFIKGSNSDELLTRFESVALPSDFINIGKLQISNTVVSAVTTYRTMYPNKTAAIRMQVNGVFLSHLETIASGIDISNVEVQMFVKPTSTSNDEIAGMMESSRSSRTTCTGLAFQTLGKRANIGTVHIQNISVIVDSSPPSFAASSSSSSSSVPPTAVMPGSSWFQGVGWDFASFSVHRHLTDYSIHGSVIARDVSLSFTPVVAQQDGSTKNDDDAGRKPRIVAGQLTSFVSFKFSERYGNEIRGSVVISDISLRAHAIFSWPAVVEDKYASTVFYAVHLGSTITNVTGDLQVSNLHLDASIGKDSSPDNRMEAIGLFIQDHTIARLFGSVRVENISSAFRSFSSPYSLFSHYALRSSIAKIMVGSVGVSFSINNVSATTFFNNTIVKSTDNEKNVSALPALNLHGIASPFRLPFEVLSKRPITISNVRCNIERAENIEDLTATCVHVGSSSLSLLSRYQQFDRHPPLVEVVVSNVTAKYENIIVSDSPYPAGTSLPLWGDSLAQQANIRSLVVSSSVVDSNVKVTASSIKLEIMHSRFSRQRPYDDGLIPTILFISISPLAMFNVGTGTVDDADDSTTHPVSLFPGLSFVVSDPSTVSCILNNVEIDSVAPVSLSHFGIDFGRTSRGTPLFTLNYREGASTMKIINYSHIQTTGTLRLGTIIDEKVMLVNGDPLPPTFFTQLFGRTRSIIYFGGNKGSSGSNSRNPTLQQPFAVSSSDSTLSSSSSFVFFSVITSRYRNSLHSLTIDGISPTPQLLLSSSSDTTSTDKKEVHVQRGVLLIERGPENDYSEAEFLLEKELDANVPGAVFTVKNVRFHHQEQQSASSSSASSSSSSLVKFGLDPLLNKSFTREEQEGGQSKIIILDSEVSSTSCESTYYGSTSALLSLDSNIHLPWNITLTRNLLSSPSVSLIHFNSNPRTTNNSEHQQQQIIEHVFTDEVYFTLHGNRRELWLHSENDRTCPSSSNSNGTTASLLVTSPVSSSSSSSSSSNFTTSSVSGNFMFECNMFSKQDNELMIRTLNNQLHADSVVDMCIRNSNTSSRSLTKSRSNNVSSETLSENETFTATASSSSSPSNSINSTLSRSYISISKSELTETNSKQQVIVSIGLDAEILTATIATAQSVTAVASVLGSAPMAAMSMSKSLSVLQLLGCPRFDPQGRRWSEVDPGFSWTLLPTITFAGGYYHAAVVGFVGLCLLGAIVGLCSKSMPPPPKDPSKKKEQQQDKSDERLYAARGGRFLNFLAMATFPFLGQFFSAAGVVIGNASLAMTTDSGAIDYILGVSPFIFSLPLIFIGFGKLNDAITVRRKVTYKQPIIEINARTKQEDFRLEPVTKHGVVPYYGTRSFIARSLTSIYNSKNDEFSKVKKVKLIQGLLKSSFGRFFLIGHYTWIQDESYFKSVFQKCKNEEGRQKVRRSHLLLTIPRLFVRLKGPVKETNIIGIEEVDAESWRPKLSTFYVLICAVAAMVCCFLQGLSKGMDNEESMCRTAIGVIAAVSLAMFFLTLYLRPLVVPFFNVLFIILEFCGAAVGLAVFILTESYPESFPSSVSNSVTVIQLLAISSATFVGFLLLLIKLLRISLMLSSGLQLVNEEEYLRRNKMENEIRFGIESGDGRGMIMMQEMGAVGGLSARSNSGINKDNNNLADPLLLLSPSSASPMSAASTSATMLRKKKKPVVVILQKKKIVKIKSKRETDTKQLMRDDLFPEEDL